MKPISFKVDSETLDIIELYANLKKISRSEAIRDLIWQGFKCYQEKENKRIQIKVERMKLL